MTGFGKAVAVFENKKIKIIPAWIKLAVVFALSGVVGLLLPQVLCGGHSVCLVVGKPDLHLRQGVGLGAFRSVRRRLAAEPGGQLLTQAGGRGTDEPSMSAGCAQDSV